MGALLAGRDRTVAGPTAAPDGLLFVGPMYPEDCHLPAEVTMTTTA
jgi:tRNA pseudouridine38-40 synthase